MMKNSFFNKTGSRIITSLLIIGLYLVSPSVFAEWCQKGEEPPKKCRNGRWCDSIPSQYCRGERGCPCYKAKRAKKCGAQCIQDWDCLGAGKGNCTKCIEQKCSCPCKVKQAPCAELEPQLDRELQPEPEQEFRHQDYW